MKARNKKKNIGCSRNDISETYNKLWATEISLPTEDRASQRISYKDMFNNYSVNKIYYT